MADDALPPDPPVRPSATITPFRRGPGRPPGGPKPPGSGRKRGTRNKVTKEIREIAAKHGARSIRELVKLLKTSSNEQVRLKAAAELLDRGFGRPPQSLEHSGPAGGPIETREMDDREFARQIAFALASGERKGG